MSKQHYKNVIKELDKMAKDLEEIADKKGYDIDNDPLYQSALRNITAVDMYEIEENKAKALVWAGYYLGQVEHKLLIY